MKRGGWQTQTLPSLLARQSNNGQTDGLNLHGRLSAFPISRMHTFSSPGNSLGSQRGKGEEGRLIINGVDFGINQGCESRRASSRANEKKGRGLEDREGKRSRSIDNGQINPASLNKRKPAPPQTIPSLAARNSRNGLREIPVAFACVIITIV